MGASEKRGILSRLFGRGKSSCCSIQIEEVPQPAVSEVPPPMVTEKPQQSAKESAEEPIPEITDEEAKALVAAAKRNAPNIRDRRSCCG